MERGWLDTLLGVVTKLSRSTDQTGPHAVDWAKATLMKWPQKSGVDKVVIRVLKIVKDSAMKARTQAINQMKALVVTAPVELREELAGLNARRLVDRCISFRPGRLATPVAAAKHALRLLARRHSQLTCEIKVSMVRRAGPAHRGDCAGIGPHLRSRSGHRSHASRGRQQSRMTARLPSKPHRLFRQDRTPPTQPRRRSTSPLSIALSL